MDKRDLIEAYDEILDSGCLSPAQRNAIRRHESLPDVLIQQSSGSSGAPPLRIPRTRAETNWLGMKLRQHYVKAVGQPPKRVALLGGISHMEAEEKVEIDQPLAIRNYSGEQLQQVDAFDPDLISMYPSFCREIVADGSLGLSSLRGIKLGGETIFPADLEGIWRRFPGLVVIEQLGSTEMPAIAFRTRTETEDTGYVLSTDRFRFDFTSGDGWQPLVVRDEFPERAFPIPGWFQMDDEGLIEGGALRDVRRIGDPLFPLRGEIDQLYRSGCVNVQLFPSEGRLFYEAIDGRSLPEWVELGEVRYRTTAERPYRLVDSNKLPLVVDTPKVTLSRLHRVGG